MLARTQSQLNSRPNNLQADVLAHTIIRDSGLQHDPRKDYFFKLAKCALLGHESMYNAFPTFKKEKRK